MWLTFLMIAFAVAMVVGPVMMIRPTRGMTKVAKLRSLAAEDGMHVRLPAIAATNKYALYSIPLTSRLSDKKPLVQWSLVKKRHPHEIHVFGYWDWADDHRPSSVLADQLPDFLRNIPEGFTLFECNAIGISCAWDEYCRGQEGHMAVQNIKRILLELRELVEVSECASKNG